MFPWRSRKKKKSVEPRSREQSRANSELSFELGLTLSLQWFCKIPFSEPTYFELKVLIAELVPLESQKKKICWTSQQGTEQSIFRVIFWTRFNIITPIILQNTIFRTILFRIEGFDSWTCSYGKPKKKIFSTSQQGTEQSIFRFIFWIRFEIITTMILQIPPSAPTFSNWNFW